jgi:hypothetical protein
MNGTALHQLVHGYAHGHSLLACSTQLDAGDLDLTARLSDLSGSLVAGPQFRPYLTLYPLPSEKYFVLAKTWPDEAAPRGGCVLTHSLLIPYQIWAATLSPSRFLEHLHEPTRENLADFASSVIDRTEPMPTVFESEPLGSTFVRRYFGEDLVPLVWFGAGDPDSAAMAIVTGLWPNLRSRFSCCTLALQPRSLGHRPFDLHFSPPHAYSRFSEFSREHVIDDRQGHLESPSEKWVDSLTKYIFESDGFVRLAEVRDLSLDLPPYPTSIRKVFFFLELKDRIERSPTAAVGAFDLLEGLAPRAESVTAEKRSIAEAALNAIDPTKTGQALEQLYLLCQRFESVSVDRLEEYRDRSERLVGEAFGSAPLEALEVSSKLIARQPHSAPMSFLKGLGVALVSALTKAPSAIEALLQQDVLGPQLLYAGPVLGAAILRNATPDSRGHAVSKLAIWCGAIEDQATRARIRSTLFPEISRASDAPLVEVLLDHVPADEVGPLCELIDRREVFNTKAILGVIVKAIGQKHGEALRLWSMENEWNSPQVSALMASSFPLDEIGMSQLLTAGRATDRNRAHMLAAFIGRVSSYAVPRWLVEQLQGPAIWQLLLDEVSTRDIEDCLLRLAREVVRSGFARAYSVLDRLDQLSGTSADVLRKYALQQFVADYLRGRADDDAMRRWLSCVWISETLIALPTNAIGKIVVESTSSDRQAWARAWSFLVGLSDLTSERFGGHVLDTVSTLLNAPYDEWSDAVDEMWSHLLRRYIRDANRYSALCEQALRFALNHQRLSLAKVVAQSFYTVHETAMADNWSVFSAWSFGDWDKGRELRRSLVDAFTQSKWQPEQFVLAAKEPWLLRKLCKRMRRQWNGERFLQEAHAALRRSPNPQNQQLLNALTEVLRGTSSLDDWD